MNPPDDPPKPVGARPGEYVAPALGASAFTCPHCDVIAHVEWGQALTTRAGPGLGAPVFPIAEGRCVNCGKATVWVGNLEQPEAGNRLVWPPDLSGAPIPHPDMPDDVRADYDEARAIVGRSPRGAAALLRLAVEKLARSLTGSDDKLDKLIGQLVADGLPVTVQQALDALRVIGNNAVHPGQIDADDPAIAATLFALLNLIVEQRITQPREVHAIYSALPPGALEAIDRRDTTS